jgi:hypothetical protein
MAPNTPQPLDRLDPEQAWRPWQPVAGNPWNLKWAGHLYRRAGFGASHAELKQAVKRGLPATIDLVMKGEPGADDLLPGLIAIGQTTASRDNPHELRAWWLYCMLNGKHPLREKMTLFWHNHFATSIAKVKLAPLMFKQNCLLREHALGKFHPFLLAMSKDPAMLIWLDSNSNVKGRPNENYAREVMELFSLGVGNYSEKDIREAARAFTGWHTDDETFEFNAKLHDDGTKSVLRQTGKWDGGDIVRILLEQKAAARFLTYKLYRFLISEAQLPPDELLEPLAEQLRKSDYDIGALVRTMLSSQHFYSEYAFRQRIKSPVDYVLGAVRAATEGPVAPQALVMWLERMGQQLFAPPNVKGWREGQNWLNTSTVLARQNFAQALAMGTLWKGTLPRVARNAFEEMQFAFQEEAALRAAAAQKGKGGRPEEPPPAAKLDPAQRVRSAKAAKPEEVVRVLLDTYLPGEVRASARKDLVAFIARGNPTGPALDRRVREAVHAILAMPDSQLS